MTRIERSITMSVIEALITIKNSIYNLELKATETNIRNINQSIGLLNALIELETQGKKTESEPEKTEENE